MPGKNATRILSWFDCSWLLPNPATIAMATTAAIPKPIGMEIFIKQRYKSELNSDRILAPAITKLLKNFRT
jgi:hypothetical protein